jgi:hypothetical protein
LVLGAPLRHEFQIKLVITSIEKRLLSAIAALREMV